MAFPYVFPFTLGSSSPTTPVVDRDPDLAGTETWRFEVLDQFGNVAGEIHPDVTLAPTITHDAAAAVQRTLSRLRLDPTDTASIDRYRDRVRPVRVGPDGTETAFGVFLWAADTTAHQQWGDTIEGGVLYDLGQILTYGLEETVGYDVGNTITTLLADLIEGAGIVDHDIRPSSRKLADPLGWPVGTARHEPISHLLELLGYTAHFNGDGTWVAEPMPLPGIDAPAWIYDHGTDSVIVAGSPVTTTDQWQQPNVFLVSSSAPNGATILGRFELPADHPASFSSRGYRLTSEVHMVEGLESSAQADELARVDARKASAIESVSFATGPEAHGHMNVVSWMGEDVWQEVHWTLPCQVGGLMSHRIEKVVL